jgi:hypothetical protein
MSIVERAQRTALFVSLSLLPSAAAHAQPADPPLSPPAVSTPAPRPALLTPLYGSFIGLQALDFDSTMRAVRSGAGREFNPVLQPIAGSPAALLAVKAGTTAAIILTSERLRKDGHPVAAVMLMIGLNSAYAMVTAHNYRVLQRRH